MTRDEADAILATQVYQFTEDGNPLVICGLRALIEHVRVRADLPTSDWRPGLLAIAEYVRLGVAPAPTDPELRDAVQRVMDLTMAAVAGDNQ